MNHKHIRLIGVLFAIVCIASGAMLVAHAQEDTQSISASYDYSDSEVDYQLSGSFANEWDVETLYTNQSQELSTGGTVEDYDFEWAESGNTLFVFYGATGFGERIGVIRKYSASEPYSISNLNQEQSLDTSDIGAGTVFVEMNALTFSSSGDMLYVATQSGYIQQYGISDPYNLSTVSGSTDGSLTQGVSDPTDVEFSDDGTSIYKSNGNTVNRITLNTPWDITTSDTVTSQTFGLVDIQSIRFRNGETLYLANDNIVTEYSLSTPYDLNDYTLETGSEFGGGQIDWSESGEYMYRLSGTTIERYQTYTFTVSLIDSTGTTIEGTETTTPELSGSIGYSATDYEEVRVAWENNGDSSESGTSDSIGVYGEGEMYVREEQTNNVITEPVNVTAYGEESGIYSLDTSDGTIDITGLPDQSYTFSVDATGYTLRNKYVEELGDTENLYLLANDTDRVTSQFLLEDTTNTFTSDARLVIERSIEGNGNDWEEIYSDSFGVEGATVTLQEGVRYRISIENDEIRRTIGPYRATVSEQVTINPDSGDIEIDSEGGWSFGANYDSDHINVRYTDSEDITDSVSVTIYERGNESNALVTDETYTNPQDLRAEYQVPSQYNETNWIVSLEVDRAGETTVVSMQVGPTLETVPSDLDPMWRNIISVIIILTFGLAFSALNRAVGAIVLALVGGAFWWVGWLVGATAGVLVTAYLFIAIGYGIYTKTVR